MKEIHQIHINKTGGSTIGKMFGVKFRHVDASDLLVELGHEKFAQDFVFSFVRNPWDRVVSHYYWRIKTNQTGLRDSPIAFSQWVEEAFHLRNPAYYDKPKMFRQQTEWLDGNSGFAVHPDIDFIGRFEFLVKDIERLSKRIKTPLKQTLPHLKRSDRRRGYRYYYDDKTADLVAKAFAQDILVFNYTFE
ncbi:sulfotransferase family 2 domain-containing protein [Robiginitomaculum antarcticum]|uniref:sulfotransferase family 2 domain-containing protein n=1 Tax=Robiginitomaculum antarcticum TaxID=437507 RepID=UPI0005272827|nr:sulfotransferase family 2 domain-containing protein [Robiginitomaculum antarcticum]